jgi:urease accessory protein UreF
MRISQGVETAVQSVWFRAENEFQNFALQRLSSIYKASRTNHAASPRLDIKQPTKLQVHPANVWIIDVDTVRELENLFD